MDEKEKRAEQNKKEKQIKTLTIGLIIYMIALVFFCQWLIFQTREEFGLALLIGTCGTLFGCFAALLASPFTSSEQERLSKVGSIISTLVTGYILAKLIDPLTALLTSESTLPLILQNKNGANVLIALVGFLSGFLLAYQYRVNLSGNFQENKKSTDPKESIKRSRRLKRVARPRISHVDDAQFDNG